MKNFKPFLLAIVMLLSAATNVNAQQHLKFMGIPMNMSIDAFQKRLAAKGIYKDKSVSSVLPYGSRMFNGSFADNRCSIMVFYNQDKTVYRSVAIYRNEDEKIADGYYQKIKNLLQTKYSEENQETTTENGYEAYNVNVIDDEGEYTIGCINLYKNEHTFEWNYDPTYIIFVDYIDSVNSADYEQELLDDM